MGTLENSRQAHSLRDSVAPCEKNGGAGKGEISHGGTETRRGSAPALRFKGFGEEWEKKRLGEIVSFAKGKGYSKADIRETGVPLFLYGRMYTDYQTEVAAVGTFCNPTEGSVYSKGSEVVCPASGETAEDIARASAVTGKGIVLGGDLNILTPKDEDMLDSPFLALALTNTSAGDEIQSRAQGKTVVHIHNSDLEDIAVRLPRMSEQRKIGAMFRELDAVIAGREEALGKLEQFKKAMLEKMFPSLRDSVARGPLRAASPLPSATFPPSFALRRMCEKNGGTGDREGGISHGGTDGEVSHGGTETRRGRVPEVRFKGFGEEWEKKRLGEIGSVVTGSTPPRSDVANWSGDFPWISAQDFRGRHIGETVEHISDKGKSFCRLLPDNTVLVTCIASIGLNAIATVPCATNQQINAIVNSKCDFEFLYDVICANVGRLRQLAGQTAVPIIGKSQFENFEIPVAPSLPEQRKIGAYFREMDALIAARREEVGKLKDLKKALLERMFV